MLSRNTRYYIRNVIIPVIIISIRVSRNFSGGGGSAVHEGRLVRGNRVGDPGAEPQDDGEDFNFFN